MAQGPQDVMIWNSTLKHTIPCDLKRNIDREHSNGRLFRNGNELFPEPSWFQVMEGHRIHAQGYHPFAGFMPEGELQEFVGGVEAVIGKCVAVMPDHAQFIAEHCRSEEHTSESSH